MVAKEKIRSLQKPPFEERKRERRMCILGREGSNETETSGRVQSACKGKAAFNNVDKALKKGYNQTQERAKRLEVVPKNNSRTN